MADPCLPCMFGARLKEVIARSPGTLDTDSRYDMRRRQNLTWYMRALLAAAAAIVSMAPLSAQDSSCRVLYQTGPVSIFQGGYLKALSVGDQVAARQVIVTGPDGYAKFEVLSDRSTFEVFPNSKVVFRETPGSWEHLLNVFLGRVKVFIQHAPGVANPNNVTSPIAVISVRGTIFDVVVEPDGTTSVSLDQGIVDVRNTSAPGNSVLLKPTESITVYRGVPLVALAKDHSGFVQRALNAARDIYYQVMIRRAPGGPGVPIPPGTGGAQGDKKPTGGTAPGAPPTAPGAPPAGPGGGA